MLENVRSHFSISGSDVQHPYYSFVDRIHPINYRKEEIELLAHAVRAKENRLIISLPDVGISNLMRFFITRSVWHEQETIFAYLNCDTLGDCTNQTAFFEEISRQFAEQGLTPKPDKILSGFEQLRRFLVHLEGKRQRRLIVIVDKATKMTQIAQPAFYRSLKGLTDLNKSLCYFFTIESQNVGNIDPDELLFAGRKLYVTPFNERDCLGAIAEEGVRLGIVFKEIEQERLVLLTGGHPGLLRAITSAIFEEEIDLAQPLISLLELFAEREDVQARCLKIWKGLTSRQQSMLSSLVRNSQLPNRDPILAELEQLGLIQFEGNSVHSFSPVWQDFVAKLTPSSINISPKINQKPPASTLLPVKLQGTSTITHNEQEIVVAGIAYKGEEELSLSPLELRLIACLKQENRIFTKDEIAEYLYYEEYDSGEAATDARIENLIRNVRNRLGDSKYIKTYRGQGYKFMS